MEKLPPKILVLETDDINRAAIANNIERANFDVMRAKSADHAITLLEEETPTILLVSSKNADFDLIAALKMLRAKNNLAEAPAIILLNRGDDASDFQSVDNGFNEYLKPPATINEIMAAVKLLIRKAKPVFQDKMLTFKDIEIDLATYKVFRQGKRVHLGPTEFKILHMMVSSPRQIFSRKDIIDHVWEGREDVALRTVDVHVNRLRAIIKAPKEDISIIKTIRAAGYCLTLPGEYNDN